jgi:hypothetical protein
MRPAEYLDNPCPKGARNNPVRSLHVRPRGGLERVVHPLGTWEQGGAGRIVPAEIANTINSAMSRPLSQRRPAYDGPEELLAWDAIIADEESSPSVPSQTEDTRLPGPAPKFAREDFHAFLQALFRPEEIVAYNSDFRTEEDGHVRPRGRGVYVRPCADLDRACSRESTAEALNVRDVAGAWVRLNPMDGKGIADANVVEYRHALVESDSLPVEQQWAVLERLKVPCATVVHSGGNEPPSRRAHRAERTARNTTGAWPSCIRSPSNRRDCAWTGRTGTVAPIPDAGVTRLGRPPYLLATNLGCPSWEAWMEHLCADETSRCPSLRDLRRNPPPLAPEIIHGILRRDTSCCSSSLEGGQELCPHPVGGGHRGRQCVHGSSLRTGRVLYVNLEIDRASFRAACALDRGPHALPAETCPSGPCAGASWNSRRSSPAYPMAPAPATLRPHHSRPDYKTNDGDENSARDMTAFCNSIDPSPRTPGRRRLRPPLLQRTAGRQGTPSTRASGSGVFGRDPDASPRCPNSKATIARAPARMDAPRVRRAPPVACCSSAVHRVEKLLNDRKVKGAPDVPKRSPRWTS